MMQGDTYFLTIKILDSNQIPVTADDVSDVEVQVGNLRKTYLAGEVKYDSDVWKFPLDQEETFGFQAGAKLKCQVRVKLLSGDVVGAKLGEIRVDESMSKEVL